MAIVLKLTSYWLRSIMDNGRQTTMIRIYILHIWIARKNLIFLILFIHKQKTIRHLLYNLYVALVHSGKLILKIKRTKKADKFQWGDKAYGLILFLCRCPLKLFHFGLMSSKKPL